MWVGSVMFSVGWLKHIALLLAIDGNVNLILLSSAVFGACTI